MPLAKPDKKQEKRPRVLLLPPSALPIPAVRGGAVETLITHLIRENERQGKLDILCASVQDPDAKAAAADLQHTKMMYITRPRGHRRYWPMAFVERLFWRGRALRPLVPEGAAVAGAGTAPARLDHCRGRQPDPVRGHQPDVRPPALPGPPAWPDPVQPPDGRDLRRRAGPERVYPGRVPENQHPRPQKRPISCTTASTPGGSPPASRIWRCGPRWGFAPEDFVVLFCGRLEPDKGIHKLLEAIASLEDPRVKLLIVGSPFFGRTQTSPFLKKLEAAAPQPGRPTRYLRVLSAKRVPAGLLPAGRPGLHAHAGAGGRRLVAIEAMACGRPVLATRSGGLPEYLAGSQAVLVDLNRDVPGQLAFAIEMLRDHPELRAEMGRAGAQAAKRFSVEAFYNDFVRILADRGERA